VLPESHPKNAKDITNGAMAGTIFTDAHTIVTGPVPGLSMAAEHWRDLWPIGPMLKNYPTEGPNDPVPIGYNLAPINYLP